VSIIFDKSSVRVTCTVGEIWKSIPRQGADLIASGAINIGTSQCYEKTLDILVSTGL